MKNFDFKLFLYLFFAFLISTIIGTLSHEFGHFLFAKFLGYNAYIHYAFTSIGRNVKNLYPNKEQYFYFVTGGPMQTILTGTIGFF